MTTANFRHPTVDADSRPYWEAAARGEFVLQHCRNCDSWQFYGRLLCISCLGPVEWVSASGKARINSFTVIHRPPAGFESVAPYVVALCELREGPRLLANIVDVDPAAVRIGDAVEVTFERVGEDMQLVQFRPDRKGAPDRAN